MKPYIPILLLGAFILTACGGKSGLIGSWTAPTPKGDGITKMTFNPDGTTSFSAEGKQSGMSYKLSGIGTWKLEGTSLTVNPTTMSIDGLTADLRSRFKPTLDAQINVPQKGEIVWKSSNEFVSIKNSEQQDFKRVN